MTMKKGFKLYSAIWAILLALFNIISFVSVGWTGISKYTPSFWIGYTFITLSFIGQIVCAYFALKDNDIKKMFYNISLISTSYTGLILSFIFGGLCMVISSVPYWVGIILCIIVLAFNIIAIIKASAAADIVSEIDGKISTKTFFIKSLTVDAESLISRAKNENIKAECKKVYEAARYSDPMSNDVLASIESDITIKFSRLSEAVISEDLETVVKLADEIIILLGDRNKKCKLLK